MADPIKVTKTPTFLDAQGNPTSDPKKVQCTDLGSVRIWKDGTRQVKAGGQWGPRA